MTDAKLYYTPPSDEIFNDMKQASIKVWEDYESEGYRNEKIGAIAHIQNIQDNFMYMLAMFDSRNQRKVAMLVKDETKEALRERMIDGGTPNSLIPF